jgi:hypothetical protein
MAKSNRPTRPAVPASSPLVPPGTPPLQSNPAADAKAATIASSASFQAPPYRPGDLNLGGTGQRSPDAVAGGGAAPGYPHPLPQEGDNLVHHYARIHLAHLRANDLVLVKRLLDDEGLGQYLRDKGRHAENEYTRLTRSGAPPTAADAEVRDRVVTPAGTEDAPKLPGPAVDKTLERLREWQLSPEGMKFAPARPPA